MRDFNNQFSSTSLVHFKNFVYSFFLHKNDIAFMRRKEKGVWGMGEGFRKRKPGTVLFAAFIIR